MVFALLALTAFTLIALNFRPGGTSPNAAIRRVGSDVFGPVERAFTAVAHPIGSELSSLRHLGSYRGEVTRLRHQNAELSFRLHQQQTDAARLANLEALDGLAARGAYRIVHARADSYGSALGYQRTIGIDAGAADGVQVGQTVIAGAGLVGRVQQVSAHTSTVELAIDQGFVAGAQLAPNGADSYTTGSGGPLLALTVLDPSAHLSIGEEVVTYPDRASSALLAPDVPIGRVVSVHRAPGATTPTAQVSPYVDFTALDYVGVVVATGPGR